MLVRKNPLGFFAAKALNHVEYITYYVIRKAAYYSVDNLQNVNAVPGSLQLYDPSVFR